ncbi:MAG TPA: hypothetical protein VIJ79_05835 [Acidobacteriaceae bacterium]
MSRDWISKVLTDSLSAFAGGGSLAVALFWLREKVFPLQRVNGRWYLQVNIKDSARNSFQGMSLKYEAILWQEGPVIRGTTEKTYESSVNGRRRFGGTDRSRGEISGYLDKLYFSKDRVRLHLVESGGRTSTTYFDLKLARKIPFIKRKPTMEGFIESMIGSSSGTTLWSKNRYDEEFSKDVREEDSDTYGPVIQIAAEAEEPEAG